MLGRSEIGWNSANYAQKCGKKLSFAMLGRSEIGWNPANYAQKCGKKLSFYRVRTFRDRTESCEMCAKVR